MSLSNKGFTLFMTPNCFATSITPSVPVNFRRNFAANFLAFKSSSSNNGDAIFLAKALRWLLLNQFVIQLNSGTFYL